MSVEIFAGILSIVLAILLIPIAVAWVSVKKGPNRTLSDLMLKSKVSRVLLATFFGSVSILVPIFFASSEVRALNPDEISLYLVVVSHAFLFITNLLLLFERIKAHYWTVSIYFILQFFHQFVFAYTISFNPETVGLAISLLVVLLASFCAFIALFMRFSKRWYFEVSFITAMALCILLIFVEIAA